MQLSSYWKRVAGVVVMATAGLAFQAGPVPTQSTEETPKKVYLPNAAWHVPKNNAYADSASEYSYHRMVESPNFSLFWAKEFGDKPLTNPDATRQFDTANALAECERFYDYYVNTLKFVRKGKSLTDQYKMLIYVLGGKEGTAFGGGAENKIGMLWTPAVRMNKAPYGALAHELGHSFQYMVHADGAWGFSSSPKGSRGQAIFEMTSQYMLWQVYPEWMTFENYHLKSFMQKTHYAFLHETNQYHSPYVLEYWATKHGPDFIGKLWRGARKGEDPVMAYQRLTRTRQHKFNDEQFEAARRFITWDLKRIEQVAAPYANQHRSALQAVGDDWYRITASNCPQNYGYNGIKLTVPTAGTKVTLAFKGMAGSEGFRAINTGKAGWRYGFLAVQEDGSRAYGKIMNKPVGQTTFVVPKRTQHLWLVVSGAPTEHWEHLTDGKDENDEQWPYQIKLSGTALDAAMITK